MSNTPDPPYAFTLHVRDHCLCLHIRRAARAAARLYDEALRPLGLNNGQFSLLMALNRPEPAGMGDVATLLAMDRTTLTANLKPLERRGLICRVIDGDRRRRRLKLTEGGRQTLRAAVPLWHRAQAEMEALVGNADPDELRAVLRALAKSRTAKVPPRTETGLGTPRS